MFEVIVMFGVVVNTVAIAFILFLLQKRGLFSSERKSMGDDLLTIDGLAEALYEISMPAVSPPKEKLSELRKQIGWFCPETKRFCYSDEKSSWPKRRVTYSVPVFIEQIEK